MASQLFMDNSRHSSLGLGSEAAQSCNEDRIKISPETVRTVCKLQKNHNFRIRAAQDNSQQLPYPPVH